MSNKEPNNTVISGVGFPALLTLLFIGLKLTGFITWSWIWVLSPIWISFVLVIAVIIFVIILTVLYSKHFGK